MVSGRSIEAVKEFADIHDLLPKNIRLKADDVFVNLGFILSLAPEAHFAGQTKQKLISSPAQTYVQGWVKSQMILWLSKNVNSGETLLESIIENAHSRQQVAQIERKRVVSGPQLQVS